MGKREHHPHIDRPRVSPLSAIETWRQIPGRWNDYEVSSKGNVRIRANRRTLKPTKQAQGYVAVTFQRGGKYNRQTVRVHTLVAAAFIGPRPAGMLVRHRDGSRDNNSWENLIYGTPKENAQDAVEHGTLARGETAAGALFTDRQASMILGLLERITQADIAGVMGVGFQQVSAVACRSTYAHVEPSPLEDALREFLILARRPISSFVAPAFSRSGEAVAHKLTWEIVDRIRADRRSATRMAPDYGVSQPMISMIKRGKAWKPETDPRLGVDPFSLAADLHAAYLSGQEGRDVITKHMRKSR